MWGDGSGWSPWLFWLACGLSIALHLGLALFLLNRWPERPGLAAPPTTAISVNLEASDILNAPAVEQQAQTSTSTPYVPA